MTDLRQLRQFVAVAEELSFRRAADRLHMSQPPLSQMIRALEKELGVMLFERTRRKVELTQPGRVLLDQAHRVLSQMERALAAARGAGRGMTGRLTVGFVSSSTYEILPAILRRFRAGHPAVDLQLEELDTVDQTDALLQHRIDVALNRPPTFYASAIAQDAAPARSARGALCPHPAALGHRLSHASAGCLPESRFRAARGADCTLYAHHCRFGGCRHGRGPGVRVAGQPHAEGLRLPAAGRTQRCTDHRPRCCLARERAQPAGG